MQPQPMQQQHMQPVQPALESSFGPLYTEAIYQADDDTQESPQGDPSTALVLGGTQNNPARFPARDSSATARSNTARARALSLRDPGNSTQTAI